MVRALAEECSRIRFQAITSGSNEVLSGCAITRAKAARLIAAKLNSVHAFNIAALLVATHTQTQAPCAKCQSALVANKQAW
jgi:hypothetical protein